MARVIALTIGLVCVLLVAGCQPDEPTRLEFIERVDAICESANDEIAALEAPDAADASEVADVIDAIVVIQEDELESIDDLVPPRDDRDLIRQWIESVRVALDASKVAADALRDGDVSASRAASDEASLAAAAADDHARSLGAMACAGSADSALTGRDRDG